MFENVKWKAQHIQRNSHMHMVAIRLRFLRVNFTAIVHRKLSSSMSVAQKTTQRNGGNTIYEDHPL